jgi:hypothetical protein
MPYVVHGSCTTSARGKRPAWSATEAGLTLEDAIAWFLDRFQKWFDGRQRVRKESKRLKSFCLICSGASLGRKRVVITAPERKPDLHLEAQAAGLVDDDQAEERKKGGQ